MFEIIDSAELEVEPELGNIVLQYLNIPVWLSEINKTLRQEILCVL